MTDGKQPPTGRNNDVTPSSPKSSEPKNSAGDAQRRREWIIEMLGVLAVALDRPIGSERMQIMAEDLMPLPEEVISRGMNRLRRTWRGLTYPSLPDILEACEVSSTNGRPGPEQAWARMPKGAGMELDTIVWCDEEREAYFACRPLLLEGDLIAARMTFLECYRQAIQHADELPLLWSVSLGHDVTQRLTKLAEAVRQERIEPEATKAWIPPERETEFAAMLPPAKTKGLLTAGEDQGTAILRGLAGAIHEIDKMGKWPGDLKPKKRSYREPPLSSEQREERRARQLMVARRLAEERFGRAISDSEWNQMIQGVSRQAEAVEKLL